MKTKITLVFLIFTSIIYATNFTLVSGTPFAEVYTSTVDFADIDGDGDKDVLISGNMLSGKVTKLYANDGLGNYTEVIVMA